MNYEWLHKESAPKILLEGIKLIGTKEIKGTKHNPVILGWAKELSLDKVYNADEIAWCGLAMAKVVKAAGYEPVKDPLWALNWNKFGERAQVPMLGDILTFTRNGGGHVGIYICEDDDCYHVMGGNQSDSYCITRIEKSRLSQARRPKFKIAQPKNVRQIFVSAKGEISTNEA